MPQQKLTLPITFRDGLFSRPSQNEQSQISIDMGPQFDLDNEVEGLSGQVGKLKNVSQGVPVYQYNLASDKGLILSL